MMRTRVATYRVQLNRDFRFQDATALLPYLRALHISDLYVSPVFQARRGSMHGYDLVNPARLNPELGTAEDFEALTAALRAAGMGLTLDIVPNHMAASPENPWWMDVLENGPASAYSAFFDVEWGLPRPGVQQRIYLPVLGEPYGTALEEQKIQIALGAGGLGVAYGELKLPLDPGTYHDILGYRLSDLLHQLDNSSACLDDLGRVLELSERLPPRASAEWEAAEARHRDIPELKAKLWAAYSGYPQVRQFIDDNIRVFNGDKGDPSRFDLLDQLLDKQPYQLTYWRVAREKINYRRFFDVNDLIGVRAEDPRVFEATHLLALRLLAEGTAGALRVDHIDGLYDPLAYLNRLRARAASESGGKAYIAAEKILSGGERLPEEWPIDGTTGYDFLGAANNVFVHPEGLNALEGVYSRYIGEETSFAEIAYSEKKRMAQELFAVELGSLVFHLGALAERDRHARDLSPSELRGALIEATASMPVYRTYTRAFEIGAADRRHIEIALRDARRRAPEIGSSCFDFLRRILLLEGPACEDALQFVMRWQQLTGPVMAKGVEDTTLYRYNRLISMNEVGGGPYPCTAEGFHAFNLHRREHWPATMNATSTHDTKRSEDVRARINLLSEMPAQWERNVTRWTRLNRKHKTRAGAGISPDANDEYLIYQTLAGAWPLAAEQEPEFRGRVKQYIVKAAREAKRHTNWLTPDQAYEDGLAAFIDGILDERASGEFLEQFRRFHRRVSYYGAVNSLAQTVLKICSPGIPDFYQGTTLWDFSLVDPDNRRPPEIGARLEFMREMSAWNVPDLMERWADGRIKCYTILRALGFRAAHARLFGEGAYIPLECRGRAAGNGLAFARRSGREWAIAAVPRFVTQLSALEKMPVGRRIWGDSAIALPEGAPAAWTNALTGERVGAEGAGEARVIPFASALRTFPAALLHGAE